MTEGGGLSYRSAGVDLDAADRAKGALKDLVARTRDAASRLAPYTRHVHLSTLVPPCNGTDGHSGFLPGDYGAGAIPYRKQLLALLEPFVQTGAWLIPEPHGGPDVHRANHKRLSFWLRTRLHATPVEPEAMPERAPEATPC